MKKHSFTSSIQQLLILTACLSLFVPSTIACTIMSGVAADGQVWNANNEDGPLGIANFINVFPSSSKNTYGYYTLSYFSPQQGTGGNIQGGMNEAGLTFDFNAINLVKDFDPKRKEAFPKGDDAILPHILATMTTVQEVIDFFDTYWFQNGFYSAQMHVADKTGRFAIISASGVQVAKEGEYLVSTNFDICGKEDGASCWRYPIATSLLKSKGASLSTMKAICQQTAQKNGGTMYSNIQNLTTGEIWFFSKHDPNKTIHTSLQDMLAKGQKSYTFSDLNSLLEERAERKTSSSQPIELSSEIISEYVGTYQNYLLGKIKVKEENNGILMSFEDGQEVPLFPQSSNTFFLPGEGISIEFAHDKTEDKMSMRMHENGYWSFTAWDTSDD